MSISDFQEIMTTLLKRRSIKARLVVKPLGNFSSKLPHPIQCSSSKEMKENWVPLLYVPLIVVGVPCEF